MDLNTFRSGMRNAMMSGHVAVRASARSTPKTNFGSKLGSGLKAGADRSFPNVAELRARLDGLHSQIRTTNDATRLGDLVDEYVMVVALITTSGPSVLGGLLPGGAILSAAVSSVGGHVGGHVPGGTAYG